MTVFLHSVIWDDKKAQRNLAKHKVTFAQAATVILDPLALTVYDKEHSDNEDRWFTLGQSSDGSILAVSHTHKALNGNVTQIRIISARKATRREQQQYENET